jgi:hypothetical protein
MRYVRIRAAIAAVGVVGGILLGANGAAAADPLGLPLPAQVWAPYFETWTTDSISDVATRSGARYFTLAFLETTGKSSCTLAWDGSKTQTVAAGRYLTDIASLRSLVGDVIPSFGGWSADQGGTEIGDSCKNVDSIANAYEQLVTTYNVTRLDFDIEGRSLTKTDGIDRRNQAIAKLQAWAAGAGRTVQVQYTLPTTRNGLEASGLAVLQNALDRGVRVDIVNPMTFDYYDRATTPMGTSAIGALTGLHAQLKNLYPNATDNALWAMEGATIMNGLDDYPKKTESTSLADAGQILAFAQQQGMSALSMWAIQRDNGGCPGTTGGNACSGIAQAEWDFTHALAPFTGP